MWRRRNFAGAAKKPTHFCVRQGQEAFESADRCWRSRLKEEAEKLPGVASDGCRNLGGGDGFHQFVQACLGACRRVAMDQIFGGCLIQLLLCNAVGGLSVITVARLDRFADFTDRGTHGAASRTVSQTAGLVLTKSFLGAGGIWHLCWKKEGV